jgi:hypothetical protein
VATTLPADAQSEAPPAPERTPEAEPVPEDPPEVHDGELAEVVVTGNGEGNRITVRGERTDLLGARLQY